VKNKYFSIVSYYKFEVNDEVYIIFLFHFGLTLLLLDVLEAEGVAQVVACLPGKCKGLNSTSSTAKTTKKDVFVYLFTSPMFLT
jgi:hypothetical protein